MPLWPVEDLAVSEQGPSTASTLRSGPSSNLVATEHIASD